jgi:hypothetical protein
MTNKVQNKHDLHLVAADHKNWTAAHPGGFLAAAGLVVVGGDKTDLSRLPRQCSSFIKPAGANTADRKDWHMPAPRLKELEDAVQATPTHLRAVSTKSHPTPAPIDHDDIRFMRERLRDVLSRESPAVRAEGGRLFERLAGPNWSVEWNLPHWLGFRYGLPAAQQRQLVAANVLGLAYVRLVDDRHDSENAEGQTDVSLQLEDVLLEAASGEYRQLLGDAAWFWSRFENRLERWRMALQHDLNWTGRTALEADPCTQLADIGAPLMIGCAAVCVLSGALGELEKLEAPVRHYLAAAVLYDHLKDWQADLAAGRSNVFVRWMLHAEAGAAIGVDPLTGMYAALTDVRQVELYTGLVLDQLVKGIDRARAVGMEGFADHLQGLHAEASESALSMVAGMEALLTQAHAILFSKQRPGYDILR